MKRPTKGYSGQEVALFPTMLDVSEPSTSPSRITSSPSHSHEPSPSPEPLIEHSPAPSFEHSPDHTTAAVTQPLPTQPSPTQPSPGAEQHFPTPNESPLHAVHSHGSDEVGAKVKTGKARKRARVVLLEDEEDDSSKQGRIDEDPNTNFAQDDEVVHDQDIAEEGQLEDSTLVLQLVLLLPRSYWNNKERVTTDPKTTKDVDWNDPSVQKYWDMKNKPKSEAQARKNMIVYLKNQSNYKMKDFEGMSYDEIRPIFEKIWDFNHNFVPMDLEIEKEKKKTVEFQEIEEEKIEKDTSKKT
ncbi:hypothetical protein Tco_1339299, partial [Tanacetum coccineum]